PFPEFEWTKLPRSHRYVTKFIEQCNYLQAMEGDYDPSHGRFLHSVLDGDPTQNLQTRNQGIPFANQNPTAFRRPTTGAWGNSDPNEPFPRAVGDRRVTETTARAAGAMTRIEDHEQAMLSVNFSEQADGQVAASVGATWWMPIFCTAGIAAPGHFSSNMRIPIDNESLMFYRLRWSWDPITEEQLAEYKHGGYTHPELTP